MVSIVGIDRSMVRRVTCRYCASILEYTSNEVAEKTIGDWFTGKNEVVRYICCPRCKQNVFVDRNHG